MGADWQAIGRDVLSAARNELYLNLPFLDAALCALPLAEGFDTPTLATDTKVLYYNEDAEPKSPKHKVKACAVPKSGQKPHYQEVPHGLSLCASAAPEREIDIIFKPRA